jgi:ubiquinone/menaquinone biosynthesis C-methylase UbiE
MKRINLFNPYHSKTKRNYISRMVDEKVKCMGIAKKFGANYWDGQRRYGYGGYKYIKGYWRNFAINLIKIFKLNSKSKILDLGCGKGFLLYEIKDLIPKISIVGLDISAHAIKNSKNEIRPFLKRYDVKKKLPFLKNQFDVTICMGLLHNLKISEIEFAIKEINRVSQDSYLMVESYRNDLELFNLQCWALTCQAFFHYSDWLYLFKKNNYNGKYEFIYFE